jgi:hypothetical protein
MPKIVTANLLATGAVVFLAPSGAWVDAVEQARVFDDESQAEDEGMTRAQRDVERALVVDAFVTDIDPTAAGAPKMSLRDKIRAFGPTIVYLPPQDNRPEVAYPTEPKKVEPKKISVS